MPETLKIGDRIWKVAPGRFPKDGMDLFVRPEIIGETSRSWLVGHKWAPDKVPKKGPHPRFAFSLEEAEDILYTEARWMLADAIRNASEPSLLRQIGELIGWKPKGVR